MVVQGLAWQSREEETAAGFLSLRLKTMKPARTVHLRDGLEINRRFSLFTQIDCMYDVIYSHLIHRHCAQDKHSLLVNTVDSDEQ